MLEKLAIIILNYNTATLTINAANYLRKLDIGASIIVVDNCSSDNSNTVIAEYSASIDDVYFVQSGKNRGYAAGNNVGIRYVRENLPYIDTIAVMNPDIKIRDKSVLEKLYSTIHKNNKIGAITTKTIFNGKVREPNECAWRFMTPKVMMFRGTILGKLMKFSVYYNAFDVCDDGYAFVDVVQGCFFVIKLDVLQKVNDFDEHTFLYTEESILAKKLYALGYKNAVMPSLYIEHNHEVKHRNLQNKNKKLFDMKCFYNSRMYYIKEYSGMNRITGDIMLLFLHVDHLVKRILCNLKIDNVK